MIEGTAEIWLGKESAIVKPNQSVLVPAGARHGFRNLENTTLHVRATLAAPIFEASYAGALLKGRVRRAIPHLVGRWPDSPCRLGGRLADLRGLHSPRGRLVQPPRLLRFEKKYMLRVIDRP